MTYGRDRIDGYVINTEIYKKIYVKIDFNHLDVYYITLYLNFLSNLVLEENRVHLKLTSLEIGKR